MAKEFLIAAVILAASAEISSAQDIAAGETQFKKCAPCHDIGDRQRTRSAQPAMQAHEQIDLDQSR